MTLAQNRECNMQTFMSRGIFSSRKQLLQQYYDIRISKRFRRLTCMTKLMYIRIVCLHFQFDYDVLR